MPNAFLTCELNVNLKGDRLYEDMLGDGEIIVVVESNKTKKSCMDVLVPSSGRKLKFQNIFVENSEEKSYLYKTINNIQNTATTLILTKNNSEVRDDNADDTLYKALSDPSRRLTLYSISSLDQIGSLYKLLKNVINNADLPPVPILFRRVTNSKMLNVNVVLVMLSLFEMMDKHKQVDVYQAVYQLQPHNYRSCSNNDDDKFVAIYENDEVFITLDQYKLLYHVTAKIINNET
ncbi:hypothetical protein HELRODRAFT_169017 [Helobdella robusta]|uniref:Uncharacterized protein n=1 Tax=Helobdella robusta TaxID=6412 RepID=T1F196_HELRO|nr:hypothetical protein HELRODRAFT_169017 [Helobdella robusta]ESO09078.1 hypothetical protein HELRODRAFT_169017 [Helobdella robusta]